MKYVEMYIKNVDENDGLPVQTGKLYLLPGLVDHHTTAISAEDVQKCKTDYNRYLEQFKHVRDTTTRETQTKQDEKDMYEWIHEMHDLLYKIGRYTDDEKLKGFKL